MTKWILRLALVALLILGGVWGWHALFPGPEQVIRKKLHQLAETASSSGEEGVLVKAARVQQLTTFFTPDVEIVIDFPGQYSQEISGLDELARLAAAARSMNTAIKIELLDMDVLVAPDQLSAEAHMTGKATVPRESTPQVQELKAQFKKVEKQWLIDRVETVKTLR